MISQFFLLKMFAVFIRKVIFFSVFIQKKSFEIFIWNAIFQFSLKKNNFKFFTKYYIQRFTPHKRCNNFLIYPLKLEDGCQVYYFICKRMFPHNFYLENVIFFKKIIIIKKWVFTKVMLQVNLKIFKTFLFLKIAIFIKRKYFWNFYLKSNFAILF